MTLRKTALLAFIAMTCQDLVATAMVISEAHYNAPIAGSLDILQWLASLVCAALAIDSIFKTGWRSRQSLVLMATISAANFAGTYAGVAIGSAVTHH